MATDVDYDAVRMEGLKTAIRLLNESGLLPNPIPVTGRTKKKTLTDAFLAALEQCDANGKLGDVPDLVYEYYESILENTDDTESDDNEEENTEAEEEIDQTIDDPDVIAYMNKGAKYDKKKEEITEDFVDEEDQEEESEKPSAKGKKKESKKFSRTERKCKGFGLFKNLNKDYDQAELPIE